MQVIFDNIMLKRISAHVTVKHIKNKSGKKKDYTKKVYNQQHPYLPVPLILAGPSFAKARSTSSLTCMASPHQ